MTLWRVVWVRLFGVLGFSAAKENIRRVWWFDFRDATSLIDLEAVTPVTLAPAAVIAPPFHGIVLKFVSATSSCDETFKAVELIQKSQLFKVSEGVTGF